MADSKGQLQVTILRKDLIRFHSLRLRDGLKPREMIEAALDAYEREKGRMVAYEQNIQQPQLFDEETGEVLDLVSRRESSL